MIKGAEAWDAVAANYRDYAEPHTSLFAADAWRLAGASAGTRVLDVAAGTGAFTLAALAGGAEVTATDLSPAMVTAIRSRIAAAGLEARATAETMDGQALALPDNAFDLVGSVFGVILFPDPPRGLAEMVRVVRRGGRVVVGAWQGAGSGAMRLFLDSYHASFPDKPAIAYPEAMQRLMTADGVAAALRGAGLTEIALHPVSHDWTFADAAWLRDHADRLYTFAPQWTALDPAERALLTDTMVAGIEALSRPALPSTALIAIGTRPA